MKGLVSFLMGVLLWVGTAWLWNRQYQVVAGIPEVGIGQIKEWAPAVTGIQWLDGRIRVSLADGGRAVAARYQLPQEMGGKGFCLYGKIRAHGLVQGKEDWEDGRVLIEWVDAVSGERKEYAPVGSVREDQVVGERESVVFPTRDGVVPVLRIEHLGKAGFFDVEDLRIVAVEQVAWWGMASWGLGSAWFGWVLWVVWLLGGKLGWRVVFAAGLLWVMGWQLMVPGPWKSQRALCGHFLLEHRDGVQVTSGVVLREHSGGVPVEGKLPMQESGLLKIKLLFAVLRPFLHAMMLCAPAWVLSFLLGRRSVCGLMMGVSFGIEWSQVAFGYGFDGFDVLDLVNDAIGITLGCWGFWWLGTVLVRRWPESRGATVYQALVRGIVGK